MGKVQTVDHHVVGFDEALGIVLERAADVGGLGTEVEDLLASRGRVLAAEVVADRHQPAFDRSTRDGFAVRAAEATDLAGVDLAGGDSAGGDLAGGDLAVVGQVRAGELWAGGTLAHGAAVEIMTGAAVPRGADAVVMVEHVERSAAVGQTVAGAAQDMVRLAAGRSVRVGENIVPTGSEARAGDAVLRVGRVIDAAAIALAAACGEATLTVFRRPTVAIVATGDELVEVGEVPSAQQIRNSNSYGLAALVAAAGGEGLRLPIARDRREELAARIGEARSCHLLLLSGGVSMGRYDLVEEVLAAMGAEFFFNGVRMQPGKPVVFGRLPEAGGFRAQFFFGLPGNPVSTEVTFHCFVAPLLRAMTGTGAGGRGPRFVQATLGEEVSGKAGLMRVLPALLTLDRVRPVVRLAGGQGSGDLAANARANCYAVLPPEQDRFAAGDVITVLLR